jgi:SAM-dependent methyltransferase
LALGIDQLRLVAFAANRFRKERGEGARLHAVALGFPDLLATDPALDALLGPGAAASLPLHPRSEEIVRWHGVGSVLPRVRDSAALLDRLGLDVEVVDIAEIRGGERIVDLNLPLPDDMAGRYDLLIDTGTLEHCFNVGQALMNVAASLAEGGCLVHAAPMNIYNHGFWNFSPTLYFDFLGDNGFTIDYLQAMSGHVLTGMRPVTVQPHATFADAPPRTAIHLLARRTEVRPLVFPVQRKYRTAAPAA